MIENLELLAKVLGIQPTSAVTKVMSKNHNEIAIEITKPNFPDNGYRTGYKFINKYELEHKYKEYIFDKFNIFIGSYIGVACVKYHDSSNKQDAFFESIIEACEFVYKEMN